MKRIFTVVCLLAFAFTVSAQGGGQRPAGGAGGFQQSPEQIAASLETMKNELGLNEKQFEEFKKVEEETRTKQQALMQNAGGDMQSMRDASTKLREEQSAKMKGFLTADQFKKYEELNSQRMQRAPGGGGGR